MSHMDIYWIMVGSVLQFQPTRLFLYICYFCLGIYGYKKGWFSVSIPGGWLFWFVAATGLLIVFLLSVQRLTTAADPSLWVKLSFGVTRSGLCLALFMLFLVSARGFNSTGSAISRFFSTHSYNIYLIHYGIVVILQYLLLSSPMSPYLKSPLIAVLALGASCALSYFVVKPYPRIFVLSVVTVTMIGWLTVG